MIRQLRSILVSIFLFGLGSFAFAQNATVQGQVSDTSAAVIVKAHVRAVNQQTGTELRVNTNGSGQYSISALEPGVYKIFVQAPGFSTAVSDPITLNVGQNAVLDFKLKIGSSSEQVVVDASSTSINTSDASVSSVIDREFVRDMPLNGRSFQNLILLSPGVLTNAPQQGGNDEGEFSVNGLRTSSNYHMVDDVSANNQAYNWGGVQSSGMGANSTSLGTTQSILPLDALEEFRISTNSYSAVYGRQPGAQISIESRSGTNQYHGDAYNYIRNTVFDSNNWFNTYTTPLIPTPPEKQNDFGGTFGGPISIPRLFSGKDRLFFFGAYEQLHLVQPINATIYYVPSNGTHNTATYSNTKYKNLRQYAPAALQPVLNAFPAPNCDTTINPQCVDYGDGMSPYLFSGSAPATIHSMNFRVDAQAGPGTKIFARYTDTTSERTQHIGSGPNIQSLIPRTRVFLLGADSVFRGTVANELRLQYSPASTSDAYSQDLSDGAQPANLCTLQGLPPVGGESYFKLEFKSNDEGDYYCADIGSLQSQPNAVDIVSWSHGKHFFKAGADYRQTATYLSYKQLSRGPAGRYIFETATQVLNNTADEAIGTDPLQQTPISRNLGLFAQDEWRATQRLTVNLGLRWDFNPTPYISGAPQYTYAGNIHDPASVTLSTLGAPLYQNDYTDFQPRVGFAYVIHQGAGYETVLRAGGGLFYDLVALNETIGSGNSLGPGSSTTLKSAAKQPFPLPLNVILAPLVLPGNPPYSLGDVADPHVTSPRVAQWNVALEQGIGTGQTFTLRYVGTEAWDLINQHEYSLSAFNKLFTSITQYENGPGSNYNALQVSYRRQAFRGLQVLASYTWSHAIDSQSNDDAFLPLQRGNSDHDVRNNFTGAMVYNIPSYFQNHLAHYLTSGWNYDLLVVTRSGFPVEPTGSTFTDPDDGNEYTGRLDYNGKYPYVRKTGIPGGRQFDPTVFSVPLAGEAGLGSAPRNFLRGFGEFEADTALQRTFALHEGLGLLFRVEAFNVLNHPNFGVLSLACGTSTAAAVCNSTTFGQATGMLSTALSSVYGPGGLNSIYQQGGPRSLQFALKLQF